VEAACTRDGGVWYNMAPNKAEMRIRRHFFIRVFSWFIVRVFSKSICGLKKDLLRLSFVYQHKQNQRRSKWSLSQEQGFFLT
jgi:hypothetical protein